MMDLKPGDTRHQTWDGEEWVTSTEYTGMEEHPEIRVGSWVRFHRTLGVLDQLAADHEADLVTEGVGPVTGIALSLDRGRWQPVLEVALAAHPGRTTILWPDSYGDTIELAFP